MHSKRFWLVIRISAFTALGIVVGIFGGRASDVWWWQILPWVLLAGFWAYLLIRSRYRSGGGEI